jgi:protein-L-isoaspartate(D-aspartate) O-methyltransferase
MTTAMNLETARFNMIHQQICPWQVLDADVLTLLAAIKREDFVPPTYRGLACADTEIPLGHGAAMLAPKIEARALQALGVRKHERILEVGAGSGFMAALLATHAEHVWSVEIEPALVNFARANLQRAGIYNATVETGDGALGWPTQAPYDAIMVSGGVSHVPAELLAQLKVGGRLFAIVGEWPVMTAQLVTRVAEDAFSTRGLFETLAELLRNVPAKPQFDF